MHKMTSAAYNRAGAIPSSVARALCGGDPNRRTGRRRANANITKPRIHFLKRYKKESMSPSFFLRSHAQCWISCKFFRFFPYFLRNFCFIPKSCQFKLDTELAFMSDMQHRLGAREANQYIVRFNGNLNLRSK